jgi:excisionase family DNA binding protein
VSAARKRAAAAPPEPVGQLVTLAAAAERLSVCTRTLRRAIDRGQIRAVRVGHGRGHWRIDVAELARIIAEGMPRD